MEIFRSLNNSLGGLSFGTDGDGNYGYYGADGSLVPFKMGYNTAVVVHSASDTSYHSIKISSDTYGTDFIVFFEVYAYLDNYYSYSISPSDGLSCSYLINNNSVTTRDVRSHLFVLKINGTGTLTIGYQTTDTNIHAGRIVVMY